MATPPARGRLLATLRALVAVAGGYGLTALAVQRGAAVLAHAGMAPSEAVVAAAMLGFPAYLAWLLWALPCPSLARLLACLGLAGGTLYAGCWLLAAVRT
ncbi:MAG: hypothetical protein LBJ40_21025 [Delftia acidovorans]|jgi:hypothetical protein|nr:hypothetical protein [Delftia acidovorans]